MPESEVREPCSRRALIAEHIVLVLRRGHRAEPTNEILAVTFVPAFPHPDEMGVDADPQTTPRPRIKAGSVRNKILASSRSDHSRMY